MNARTRGTQLRRIRKTMDAWYDASPERSPWLITLDEGDEITILAPTGCAADLEREGYKIVAAPAVQVTAAELHQRSIHWYGHAIRHGYDSDLTWTRIEAVQLSPYQGVEIVLQGRGKLQACFPHDATYWVTVERI